MSVILDPDMYQPSNALETIKNTPFATVSESRFQYLHPDVLSEIFLLVAHSTLLPLPSGEPSSTRFHETGSLDVNDTIFLEPDTDQQPWTLRHICRHW